MYKTQDPKTPSTTSTKPTKLKVRYKRTNWETEVGKGNLHPESWMITLVIFQSDMNYKRINENRMLPLNNSRVQKKNSNILT